MSENVKEIFKGELIDISSDDEKKAGLKALKLDADVFTENLPDGVTKAQYKSIKKYERDYATSGLEYFGDVAEKELDKDDKLNAVSLRVPYGDQNSGNIKYTVYRKNEGRIGDKHYAVSSVNVQSSERLITDTAIKNLKNKFTEKYCK